MLKKGLLIFCAVGLFFALVPTIFLFPVETVLFEPQSYAEATEKLSSYGKIEALILARVVGGDFPFLEQGQVGQALADLTPDSYLQLYRFIVPAGWVQAQGEALIAQLCAYMNFRIQDLVLLLDFRDIKSTLSGTASQQAASLIVNSWHDCSVEDLLLVSKAVLEGNPDGIPLCKPPEKFVPVAVQVVSQRLQNSAFLIPDWIDLAKTEPEKINQRNYLFRLYFLSRWFLRGMPIVTIVFWLITGVISYKKPADMLRIWGLSFILAGLAAAGLAGLCSISADSIAAGILGIVIPGFDAQINVLLQEILREIVYHFTGTTVIFGTGFTGVGILAFIIRKVIK